MSVKKKTASGTADGGERSGNNDSAHPQCTTNTPALQPSEHMDFACWLLEIADGLTGRPYLAVLTLALEHLGAAEVQP